MNLNRRTLVTAAALSCFMVSGAPAGTKAPFDAAAFAAARDAGKPVILQVAAAWCGPCQRMKRTVSELLDKPEFKGVTVFEADYDADKAELQKLDAYHVTTLVLYRDKNEVLRSVGETSPEAIEPLLRKAM